MEVNQTLYLFILGIVVSNVDAGKDKRIAFSNKDLKELPIKKGPVPWHINLMIINAFCCCV